MENYDLVSLAETGDPLAIYELIQRYWYDLIQDHYETECINWMCRFMDLKPVTDFVRYYDSDHDTELDIDDFISKYEYDFETDMLLRDAIMDVGIELGLYYSLSLNLEELKLAQNCFYSAWVAARYDSEINDDDDTNLLELMLNVDYRIKSLSK